MIVRYTELSNELEDLKSISSISIYPMRLDFTISVICDDDCQCLVASMTRMSKTPSFQSLLLVLPTSCLFCFLSFAL